MEISAVVKSAGSDYSAQVRTDGGSQSISVPARTSGSGSAVNGGEFLMLALATCYCNDLYREASCLGIALDEVQVETTAEFPGVGLAAKDIRYRAAVVAGAPEDAVRELIRATDAVAEIHNTIRSGVPVELLLE